MGDPRGLNITDLLKNLTAKNIFYYFAEINPCTQKMIEEFNKELITLNANRIQVSKLSSAAELAEMVIKSVVTSIVKSKSQSMNATQGKPMKNIKVDTSPVNWSQGAMRKYKAKYFKARYDGDLTELESKSIVFAEKEVDIWMAAKPFDKGAMRFAYAGYINDGTLRKSVIKESIFKDIEYNSMKSYKELIENQVIASYLAGKFFELLRSRTDKSIRFIDVNLIYLADEGKYYSLEDFIEGDFEKWTNNAGYVDEDIYSCTLGKRVFNFTLYPYKVLN